jgi:Tol biopolymer transport system component
VQRCLEKRPEERFQSASDLAFAVENTLGTSSAVAHRLDLPAEPVAKRRGLWIGIVGALALLAAGVILGRLGGTVPQSPPTYSQLTFRQGRISTACFATDGQTVVYAADWDGEGLRLYTVHEGSPESRSLGVDDALVLSVSSEGEMALLLRPRFVTGWSRRGRLARMPLGGGAPRELLENIADADWDKTGNELAIARLEGGVSRLEYPPGNVLFETNGWVGDVRFSPDGKLIAFADHPSVGDDRGYMAVTDLEGNSRRLAGVWSSVRGAAWSADGSEIWFTAGERGNIRALHAVDLTGEARVISRAPADLILHDVRPDGRALLSRNTSSRGMTGRPPGSTEEVPLSWLDWTYPGVLSADGETVLFTEQGEGGGAGYSVFLRPTRGGPAVRIGAGQAQDLSPDGTRAMTVLLDESRPIVIYPTGVGNTERIELPRFRASAAWWAADGRRLLARGSLDGGPLRGYLVDPDSREFTQLLPEDISHRAMALHPKRDRIAVRVAEGPLQIFPVDGGEPQTLPSVGPEWNPEGWSRDGRWLYLSEVGKIPLPVVRYEIATGKREPLWELMPAESAGLIDIGPLEVSPDGDAYLYSYRRHLSTLYLATGF